MRILGIDIGSTSIRAVEVDSAFGRFDIHDYHEIVLGQDETNHQAVARLLITLSKPPERIIVALPQKYSTFRNLTLPTRDKKAVQSGIRFELEDELPFSPEDGFFDYSILNQNKQGSTAHVAATLKDHIRSTLEFWKTAGIEPDIVSSKSWALRTLFNRILVLPEKSENPILFFGMGRETSTLYVHYRGTPVVTREIRFGGQDLTRALAAKLGISEAEAETLKKDQGFVVNPDGETEITAEQEIISQSLEAALSPILIELKRTEISSKNATQKGLQAIYIGGGGALLPGMSRWIEMQLRLPTQLLPAFSSITTSGVTYSEQTDARFFLALALSLCLVGSDRASCINFRKGEFSKEVHSREFNIEALKGPLIGLGAVATSFFISLMVQSAVYKSRLASTDILLEKSVRSFFGQLSNSALKTYLANTTALRASIQKELNKQRELAHLFGPNPHSPLDFLKSISSTVPKDVVVDLVHFQTGNPSEESYSVKNKPSTSLTFMVSNPQMAEKLSPLLNSKIEDFQKGKLEEVPLLPGDTDKKLKITFSGKPSEDNYGKY